MAGIAQAKAAEFRQQADAPVPSYSWVSSGDCREVFSVSAVVSLSTTDIPPAAGLLCDTAVMLAVSLQILIQEPENELI